MTYLTMKIAGYAIGEASPMDGRYVVSYNPNKLDDQDWLVTSNDLIWAKKFKDIGELHDFWTKPSQTVPYDSPGHINRPLTAFNITIERHEDAECERDGDPA